jgi:hypothetical protein
LIALLRRQPEHHLDGLIVREVLVACESAPGLEADRKPDGGA